MQKLLLFKTLSVLYRLQLLQHVSNNPIRGLKAKLEISVFFPIMTHKEKQQSIKKYVSKSPCQQKYHSFSNLSLTLISPDITSHGPRVLGCNLINVLTVVTVD